MVASKGSPGKESALRDMRNGLEKVRERIDRQYERRSVVLYKGQVHTGTGQMLGRNWHRSHIISRKDVPRSVM
jgi:hypothetical protein